MSQPYTYTFGTYSQVDHADWVAFDPDGAGIDAPAFLLTGVLSGGDYQRNKQLNYLTMHFKKTETYSGGGSATEVFLDTPVNNLSGGNSFTYYKCSIPSGAVNLFIHTDGGTGNLGLYTAYGRQPTISDYDFVGNTSDTNEFTLDYEPSTPNLVYIGLLGIGGGYSNVSLTVHWDI